ncbi:MAG: glycosyltransferase [Mobilitalea sp.]
MRVMVFDVPAEIGGALSVLNDFYNEYKSDLKNEYIFVVSKPLLNETTNIKVLRFPWIKRSWFHRLYFDHFIASKLVREYKVDNVISLQNIIVPHLKKHQSLFVHNALPFADYRFSLFEDKLLWIYQNILSRSIFKSIRKADRVIVQTIWMQEKCIKQLKIEKSKIDIKKPNINIDVKRLYTKTQDSIITFFYPASFVVFKNHKVIIDACIKLKEQGINNYKVIFTLNGDEDKNVSALSNQVKKYQLPVCFVGSLSREKVFDYYSNSVLLFPSFIETVGLPLIEAKMHHTDILVSNCEYAHEILDIYDKVEYFDPFDSEELKIKLIIKIKGLI